MPKNVRISTTSEVETKKKKKKKKVFLPKYTRIFTNPWMRPQRQSVFIAKSTKKHLLPTNSRVITSILASNCTPIAPSLLISSGHKPRLGGAQFSFGGAQKVIWGHSPGMPPVAPRLVQTLSIFFILNHKMPNSS